VRIELCVEGELKLLEGNAYAIEPDRLMQISLGQENPPTWMNAAPGLLDTRASFRAEPVFHHLRTPSADG
jgi:hypothetical protein